MTQALVHETTIRAYLSDHHLAVLSTVETPSRPEAAVVGYTLEEDFRLIVATYTTSRKYANLKKHPHVALVMGWDGGKTLQYEGTAEELHGAAMHAAAEKHYAHVPTVTKYLEVKKQAIFRISPTWIRLIDFHQDPWKVMELEW